jgi:hypothetical protein
MTDRDQPTTDLLEPASDAIPGGEAKERRPGEVLFAAFLVVASLGLLWSAYGISGFTALSGAGSVPMATTAVMLLTSVIVLIRTSKRPKLRSETLSRDILPGTIIVMVGMLLAYGFLLRPLGFLPTSALFLIAAIKFLSGRSWAFTLIVAFHSLIVIWLIFRIVFTVLMPSGIVPEGEIIQIFRNLLAGGA